MRIPAVSLTVDPESGGNRTRLVIKMKSDISHRKNRRFASATLGALSLSALIVAGCDEDNVVYVEDGPPAVPTGVYTVTGDEWVEVRWNPVYEDDVAGYGVYRSFDETGSYTRIATIADSEGDSFVDSAVSNGVTYFYAVDAFDTGGHESELSYETAFDTPRPDSESGGMAAGPLTVFAATIDIDASAIDFSDWTGPGDFVTRADAADADVIFQRDSGFLYAVGTVIGPYANDIQDLGWTASMDDVTWSPTDGWSASPLGVELIEEHTYVVWTHDNHFAKFRVLSLNDPSNPSSALLDWAYQTDAGNPELEAYFSTEKKRAPEGRIS